MKCRSLLCAVGSRGALFPLLSCAPTFHLPSACSSLRGWQRQIRTIVWVGHGTGGESSSLSSTVLRRLPAKDLLDTLSHLHWRHQHQRQQEQPTHTPEPSCGTHSQQSSLQGFNGPVVLRFGRQKRGSFGKARQLDKVGEAPPPVREPSESSQSARESQSTKVTGKLGSTLPPETLQRQQSSSPKRPPKPEVPNPRRAQPPPPPPPKEDAPPPREAPKVETRAQARQESPSPPVYKQNPPPWTQSGGPGAIGSLSWCSRHLNRLSPQVLIWTIFAGNLIVFVMWQYSDYMYKQKQEPAWLISMIENFLHSERNTLEGRWWTWLTSAFSQKEPVHFALNMVTLFFVAPSVASLIGGARFIYLYGAGALAGSVCTALHSAYLEPYLRPNVKHRASVQEGGQGLYCSQGASGAVMAILSALASLNPKQRFIFWFVVPVSARLLQVGLLVDETLGIFTGNNIVGKLFGSQADNAAHLGGLITGILFYRSVLRRRRFRL